MKNKKKICVTGASGFIGSHLVDRLLDEGHDVIGIDNMSTGIYSYLDNARQNSNFEELKLDILDKEKLIRVIDDVDSVYHMAANADIRGGTKDTMLDLEQNTIGTYNVLEAIRLSDRATSICFASSAAALGEPKEFPTPEDLVTPDQTSLYGASKMAGEGLISAFSKAFNIESYCFRFVSLLGPRYPHGHVFDFLKKLKNDSSKLEILGDGTAQKSYLHITDCIDALILVCEEKKPALNDNHKFQVFNLGMEETITVKNSARLICNTLGLDPEMIFGHEKTGWVGDNPFVLLDVSKIKSLGWSPKKTIDISIKETVLWLSDNEWIFKERS